MVDYLEALADAAIAEYREIIESQDRLIEAKNEALKAFADRTHWTELWRASYSCRHCNRDQPVWEGPGNEPWADAQAALQLKADLRARDEEGAGT